MSEKRRIFCLTGARSEYDLLVPVMKAISTIPNLQGEIVAVAAHLSPFHGMSIEQIRQDGFLIAGCVESLLSSESLQGRAISFAQLIEGLTRLLSTNRPNILVLAGDREEALAGALVGNFLGIPVAHLFGGDRCIASDIDEVFRPAISKLAHLHFTACESHSQRLIRMGESPNYVWTCGGTGLDRLREEPDLTDEALNKEFGIDVSQPFFILIQHPSPLLNSAASGEEMREILKGILSLGCPVFCSYPNFDPGNIAIRKAIDAAKAKYSNLITYHNLSRDRFVALYRRCTAIVGNSSSIVIESGFLKVPGILIGSRQDLREIGSNVLKTNISATEISQACLKALKDTEFLDLVRQTPSLYGDGLAASRIAKVLAEIDLTPELLKKTITY